MLSAVTNSSLIPECFPILCRAAQSSAADRSASLQRNAFNVLSGMFKFTGCLLCSRISCGVAEITCSLLWLLTLNLFCFGAASSDFGLNLQIYVIIWTDFKAIVCVWDRMSFGWIVLFCVKQGFWDNVCFSHVCCCDVQNALKCKTQNPNWCRFSPDFSESCVFYNAFYDFFLSLNFLPLFLFHFADFFLRLFKDN